jgi:hypothetical protein
MCPPLAMNSNTRKKTAGLTKRIFATKVASGANTGTRET